MIINPNYFWWFPQWFKPFNKSYKKVIVQNKKNNKNLGVQRHLKGYFRTGSFSLNFYFGSFSIYPSVHTVLLNKHELALTTLISISGAWKPYDFLDVKVCFLRTYLGKSFQPKIHKNCPVEFIDFNGAVFVNFLGEPIFPSTFFKKDFRQNQNYGFQLGIFD